MTFQAWGKTERSKENGGVHPLAHHSMDVAATFLRMTQLAVIRDRLEAAAQLSLSETQCRRLSALVFLHDIGKLHPGFQAKGWPHDSWRGPTRGHLKEGWSFLMLALKLPEHPFHETMCRILGWGETAVGPLIAAALAHHGRPVQQPGSPTLRGDWDTQAPGYDWRAEARAMDDMLRCWFVGAFEATAEPLPETPRFHHLFAGLVALADWIGSDRQFFEFVGPFDPAYDKIAHRRAATALAKIHFDPDGLADRAAPNFTALANFPAPNPAQAVVGSVGGDARLLILEAETGSGKTEAALWRFTQLLAARRVSGLYFAVPTRAAARQLHTRVVAVMNRVFGDAAPEPVLAIPGMLRAGEHEGQRLPDWDVRWDDDSDAAPQRWAAEHATRFLAAPVAVGTVDQAMLAGLTVKHAHMRGSALSRSLLVIDEVHASDAYMTEIQKRLLRGHLAVGGYAMLMSATLGSRARVGWTGESLPSFETACAAPYPAVWVDGEAAPRTTATTGRTRTVRLETAPTMDPVVAAKGAVSAAECGARVLVIRNTVTAATETWRAAREAGGERLLLHVGQGPALHHGRFAAEDRWLLDRAVEEALATTPERELRGCIVIGTQTLEQSLDIDADLLVTDLCPMDVLLQRIGRLHRHDLPRPAGFETARTCILMPEGGLDRLAKPDFDNGLGAWETKDGINGIYRDLAGLELTRRLILEHSVCRIPDMNRELVEGATHPERIAALIEEKGEDWSGYDRKVGGSSLAEGMIAKLNVLDRETDFGELHFPDLDERIMTRLGEEGVVLPLDPPPTGPFGFPVTRIALPARWSGGIGKRDSVAIESVKDGLILSVGKWRFRYSREGLARESLDTS